jgi:hypothetical protein
LELAVQHETVTPWWWGLKTLIKYRTPRNYKDPEFLGPRIGDKMLMTTLMWTLYWGVGRKFELSNYVNISAILFMWIVLPACACRAPRTHHERARHAVLDACVRGAELGVCCHGLVLRARAFSGALLGGSRGRTRASERSLGKRRQAQNGEQAPHNLVRRALFALGLAEAVHVQCRQARRRGEVNEDGEGEARCLLRLRPVPDGKRFNQVGIEAFVWKSWVQP